jgi:hypothetical protein
MPTKDTDDAPVICRVCAKPFAPGEARYRDEEGDVHPECYQRRRPASERGVRNALPTGDAQRAGCGIE